MQSFERAIEALPLYMTRYKTATISLLAGFVLLISLIVWLNHNETRKKAELSASLARGFALIENGNTDEALYHLQNVFNNSSKTYKLIAAVGMVKAMRLQKAPTQNSRRVLEIIAKSYNSELNFATLIRLNLLVNGNGTQAELSEVKSALKKTPLENNFLELLAAYYLNIGDAQNYREALSMIKSKPSEQNDAQDALTLEKRLALYNSN